MNRTQLFGVVLVIIGLLLLIVFPIIGIFAGEFLIPLSVVGGWIIALIGALIVIVSLVFERLNDIKKEKFDKSF
ncbi:MAG: hypothetical protein V1672_00640 [Candidatus Diapherotrites archaeon]